MGKRISPLSEAIDDVPDEMRWTAHALLSDVIREFDLSCGGRLSEDLFGVQREALAVGLALAIQQGIKDGLDNRNGIT